LTKIAAILLGEFSVSNSCTKQTLITKEFTTAT